MARVTIELPSMLTTALEGKRTLAVEAESLQGVFDAIVAAHPALAERIFDEQRRLRPHVLCFHNGKNTRWSERLGEVPVREGDVVTVLQAVSGG